MFTSKNVINMHITLEFRIVEFKWIFILKAKFYRLLTMYALRTIESVNYYPLGIWHQYYVLWKLRNVRKVFAKKQKYTKNLYSITEEEIEVVRKCVHVIFSVQSGFAIFFLLFYMYLFFHRVYDYGINSVFFTKDRCTQLSTFFFF